jgi:hypothetical protein
MVLLNGDEHGVDILSGPDGARVRQLIARFAAEHR